MIRRQRRIPLFDGEKQQKNACSGPSQAKRTLGKWLILFESDAKFRYAAEQRNFSADQGN
jgi:hypothetical protein